MNNIKLPWNNHSNEQYILDVIKNCEDNKIIESYTEFYGGYASFKHCKTLINIDMVWAAILDIKVCLDVKYIIYGAIVALMCFDCSHLLESDPNELKLLSNLGSMPANLLFPYVSKFKKKNYE